MKIWDVLERNGKMSHTKSAYLIGVLISSWVVIHLTLQNALTSDMFLYYLGVTVLGSLGSKTATIYENLNKKETL